MKRICNYIFIFGLSLFSVIFTLYIVYHLQIQTSLIFSDYYAHYLSIINFNEKPYCVFFYFFRLIYLIDNNLCLIIFSLTVTLCKISVPILFYFVLLKNNDNHLLKLLLALSLIIVHGIVPISYIAKKGCMYLGLGAPNVYHNSTILYMQPFAILSIIYLKKILQDNEFNLKNILLLTLFITISVLIKPSFVFAIIPTLAIIFIYLSIRDKFKDTKKLLIVCCTFIPSVIIMLIQSTLLFDDVHGVAIVLNNFITKDNWYCLPFIILTPTIIYLCNYKKIKLLDVIIISYYIISLLINNHITETGPRALHGNFGWSYISALNALYFFSFLLFIKYVNNTKKWQKYLVFVLISLNLLYGLVYFSKILLTGYYY